MPRQKNTKELILKATCDLMAESGLSSTSTRAIARRVEVSENTLYRHFKDKDDLIHCVFLKLINDITEHIHSEDSAKQEVSLRLNLFVKSICTWAHNNESSMRVLLDINSGRLKQLKGISDPFDILHDIIMIGIKENVFREGNSQWLCINATGMMLRPLQMKDQGFLNLNWQELALLIFDELLHFLRK